jgi:hypothetical protein
MSENSYVKTAVVKSADIFVQEIASNGPRFGGSYYADTWYFRGHANSDWPLVPNVFRETTMLMLGEWSRGTAESNLKQIALEARLILEFATLAAIGQCVGLAATAYIQCHLPARESRGGGTANADWNEKAFGVLLPHRCMHVVKSVRG